MTQWKNAMEVFKLLDKTNCKQCDMPTCLAFAAAVFQGRRPLDDCPTLGEEIIQLHVEKSETQTAPEAQRDEGVEQLKQKIAAIDLAEAAKRLDTKFDGEKLTVKVLGKDFSVDSQGNMSANIHINSWVAGPVLNYIISGAGKPPTGEWVSFRELKNAKSWERFFTHQCEAPLKKVADSYTDLFEDMIKIFNGKQVENHYVADISLVLHPLPKVPLLICYWRPEDGLDSNLNLFFDPTAGENLGVEHIYTLGVGLVRMFEKIALTHNG
jgi:hypothetical protein